MVRASLLPLRRLWLLPRFMRYTLAIRRQLHESRGLAWYSLRAELTRRRFWTLSVWEDQQALQEFVRALPHTHVMASLAPHLSGQRFVQWRTTGSNLPPSWEEAYVRLQA